MHFAEIQSVHAKLYAAKQSADRSPLVCLDGASAERASVEPEWNRPDDIVILKIFRLIRCVGWCISFIRCVIVIRHVNLDVYTLNGVLRRGDSLSFVNESAYATAVAS